MLIKSSYGIKDELKSRGYKFDGVDGWDIVLPIDLDRLISEHEALKALNVIDDLVPALTHFVQVGKFNMAQLQQQQERVKAVIAIKPPRFYY